MAIIFPNGFKITSKEAIDSRLVMTKAEMLATKKPAMPDKYFTICADDGQIYLWNALNEIDPELGRFRLANEQLNAGIEEALQKIQELNDTLAEKIGEQLDTQMSIKLPNALKQTLTSQSLKNSGLTVDEDGNIKVNLNEDHLQVIDNRIDLAISVIQAIDGND